MTINKPSTSSPTLWAVKIWSCSSKPQIRKPTTNTKRLDQIFSHSAATTQTCGFSSRRYWFQRRWKKKLICAVMLMSMILCYGEQFFISNQNLYWPFAPSIQLEPINKTHWQTHSYNMGTRKSRARYCISQFHWLHDSCKAALPFNFCLKNAKELY